MLITSLLTSSNVICWSTATPNARIEKDLPAGLPVLVLDNQTLPTSQVFTVRLPDGYLAEIKRSKLAGLPWQVSLTELTQLSSVPADTLYRAARHGRLLARQSAGIWLSSVHALNYAMESKKIRVQSMSKDLSSLASHEAITVLKQSATLAGYDSENSPIHLQKGTPLIVYPHQSVPTHLFLSGYRHIAVKTKSGQKLYLENEGDMVENWTQEETLTYWAEKLSISYRTLLRAASESRLLARRSGKIWLTTQAAIDEALKTATMRTGNRKS